MYPCKGVTYLPERSDQIVSFIPKDQSLCSVCKMPSEYAERVQLDDGMFGVVLFCKACYKDKHNKAIGFAAENKEAPNA